MTPAARLIADAVAAVIAAAFEDELPNLPPADVERASARAVRDLRRDGWHLTALPTHHTPEHR